MSDDKNKWWRILASGCALLAVALIIGVVSCSSFVPTPQQGWNKSYGPVVPHDKFPGKCSLCHVSSNWTTIKKDFTFDHLKETGVPLPGAHAKATCLMCHNDRGPAGVFAARGCTGCHVDVHANRLGRMCSDCHTEQSWEPREQIARHNRTRFPLVGAHAATACFRCHAGAQIGNFSGADTTCLTCHGNDLKLATSPSHTMAPFTTDCQKCHIPTGWKPAQFGHTSRFPLVGGHANVACTACHKGGIFGPIPTDCVTCHLADYQRTTNPNHASAGFGTNCASCHTISSWLSAHFNHPAAFPLTQGHAGLACTACHKNGTYTGLATACVNCHLDKYQATTSPNHASAGYGTNCQDCHTTQTWLGAVFNHPFPLTGPHQLACNNCHPNLSMPQTFVCTNCHTAASTNPRHTDVGGYVWDSAACYRCHANGQIQDSLVHRNLNLRPKSHRP